MATVSSYLSVDITVRPPLVFVFLFMTFYFCLIVLISVFWVRVSTQMLNDFLFITKCKAPQNLLEIVYIGQSL